MEFTTKQKDILKVLVEKELEEIKKDAKNLIISNADYITKVSTTADDLMFLKQEKIYEEMLEKLKEELEK